MRSPDCTSGASDGNSTGKHRIEGAGVLGIVLEQPLVQHRRMIPKWRGSRQVVVIAARAAVEEIFGPEKLIFEGVFIGARLQL